MYRIEGDESSVPLEDEHRDVLEGNVFTHNHPGEPGLTFSQEDVHCACHYRMKEIRAVSSGHRYSIKPPKEGWDEEFYQEKISPVYTREMEAGYKTGEEQIRSGEIELNEENLLQLELRIRHKAWEAVAKETGVEYTLERIPKEDISDPTKRSTSEENAESLAESIAANLGMAGRYRRLKEIQRASPSPGLDMNPPPGWWAERDE